MNKGFLTIKLAAVVLFLIFANLALLAGNNQRSPKKTTATVFRYNPSPTVTPAPPTLPDPVRYQINGGSHSYQTFNNCGPASLSMTLSFYDIFVSQKTLGDELRPYQNPQGNNDDKSVTLSELAEKAKDYNLIPYHRPNGNITIIKKFITNDLPVITRTLTKIDEDIGHYRVVYGYNDLNKTLLQNDSLQGKGLEFSFQDFLDLWKTYGYEYLVLVPRDKVPVAETILGSDVNELSAWQKATNSFENELSENSNDIQLRFSLSVAYYNIGNYEKSIEEFEKVESLLPFRTLWYQTEPLLAYQKLKRYDELLPKIDKVLNNYNLAFSELYQIRGEIYLEQGRIEDAKKEFEKATFYNRNYYPAQTSLESLSNQI